MSAKGPARLRWKWVLVGLAVVAGLGGTWLAMWVRERKARQRALTAVWLWHAYNADRKADVAAKEWCDLKQDLGSAYDLLPPGERAQPYYTLYRKYFAEGQWGMAFEMDEKDSQVAGYAGPPAPGIIYLAALAGRTDWLEGLLLKERAEGRRLLICACLAWAEQRYADILNIVASNEPMAEPDAGSPGDPPIAPWLAFLRARALAELGSPDQALAVLNSGVGASVVKMDRGGDFDLFGLHVAIVAAEILERAGDLRGALALAERLSAEDSPLNHGPSWADELERMQERMKRLKARLAEETTHDERPVAP